MAGSLFDKVIFGPINSRRLGISLGINLMPTSKKTCTFNCIYCECGWTVNTEEEYSGVLSLNDFKVILDSHLKKMAANGNVLDAITFAGNGEPTLHPEFLQIIKQTNEFRNRYYPHALICVLSNSTTLDNFNVLEGLQLCDRPIMKLDAGFEETFLLLNKPNKNISFQNIIKNLQNLNFPIIIQSLFLKGFVDDVFVDNTADKEIGAWIEHLKTIKPISVMIYAIDRATPAKQLQKLSFEELDKIAEKVRAIGIEAKVFT